MSLRDRGVKAPKLAVGDGGLGFWSALAEVYPQTRAQRCRVHKTANVLDKLPKRIHGEAKSMLHEIWRADTRARAKEAFGRFLATWEAKYPRAAECLARDREALLAFYDFPAAHCRTIAQPFPKDRLAPMAWSVRRSPHAPWLEQGTLAREFLLQSGEEAHGHCAIEEVAGTIA